MKEYPKIYGPFRRETDGPNRNKVIRGAWTAPEFEALAGLDWTWTEKVDGTNIRVHWDGHKVTYGGRADRAQIPARLIEVLNKLLPEELFEQKFGAAEVTLYGEGYGAGIQKGGVYRPDMSFVLFDVLVGQWWLRFADVCDVAESLGLDRVPLVLLGSVAEAIDQVAAGLPSGWNPDRPAEGLVGTAPHGLLSRSGERLLLKVKAADFGPNALPPDGPPASTPPPG